MTRKQFDLFVVGGGSGGVRAARIAAQHGARVAIAEEYRFGGTCVIRGCVPKKLLVYASRFPDDFTDAAGFGWEIGGTRFDWQRLIAAKDREIARLEKVYRDNLVRAGVTVFDDRAELTSRTSLRLVRAGEEVTAEKVLIATGGGPSLADGIAGQEHVITSNEAFHLKELPRRIVIYGGGYIAIEFAGIFNGLGAETTIVYRGESLLRGFDQDLQQGLTEAYIKRGIRIITGRTISRIAKAKTSCAVHLNDGSTLQSDRVMFATGRRPNTKGLGLGTAGVELGKNGCVCVNADQQSSVENIYAVGDVTDRRALTPVAIREGQAFAESTFGNHHWQVDYDLIPTAVFSTPEIATVGLPEHVARQRHANVDAYVARFRPMRVSLSGRDEHMVMKLLVEAASDRVIGCHLMGPDAAEIVQIAAVALRMGARKSDFDSTMALHPSAAEELVTLRERRATPAIAAE